MKHPITLYLIGFAGTGKYTIAKELVKFGYKVIDNHLINNPIFSLYKELALWGINLKDDGLTNKYLKAHIGTFRHSHPRTQEILSILDKIGFVAPF